MTSSTAIPHVVAWNLTKRCNLACSHCYIAAGPFQQADGELSLADFQRITEEILTLNDAPMFVLSGGEPLVRKDLEDMATFAAERGVTVVVGTNGTLLTKERIRSLQDAGVQGVAVSIDSLQPAVHDRFRHGDGSLRQTLDAIERLQEAELDFVVQCTLSAENRHELEDLVAYAADRGAVSFNLYFLVETGRGEELAGLSSQENEDVLKQLVHLQKQYRGRMLVRSKCQPQIMRHVHQMDPESPLLHYSTRCPCGIQYCRITPEGKVTPCPYSPIIAGDLSQESFPDIWNHSKVLQTLRSGQLSGRCGDCEYRILCGGCRARAIAQQQGLMGPDNSCDYTPTPDTQPIQPPREVTYGMAVMPRLQWTQDAEQRLTRIPSFVRGVVITRIEDYARKNGHWSVTTELLDEVRQALPVDFSAKKPFFLRNKEP